MFDYILMAATVISFALLGEYLNIKAQMARVTRWSPEQLEDCWAYIDRVYGDLDAVDEERVWNDICSVRADQLALLWEAEMFPETDTKVAAPSRWVIQDTDKDQGAGFDKYCTQRREKIRHNTRRQARSLKYSV